MMRQSSGIPPWNRLSRVNVLQIYMIALALKLLNFELLVCPLPRCCVLEPWSHNKNSPSIFVNIVCPVDFTCFSFVCYVFAIQSPPHLSYQSHHYHLVPFTSATHDMGAVTSPWHLEETTSLVRLGLHLLQEPHTVLAFICKIIFQRLLQLSRET
ncbi:hypothetical protein SUGI_1166550 [Cryptomeria japonica]|nr:hypothetical protein SUGI_1166550 [Cryptomeria japonica]